MLPPEAATSSPRGSRPRRAAVAPPADPDGLFVPAPRGAGRTRPVIPPGELATVAAPAPADDAGGRVLGVVAELVARGRPAGDQAGPPPLSFEQAVSRLAEICSALADGDGRPIVPECLTFEQAAVYLGCSRSRLYEMHNGGLLPAPVELGEGDGCKRFIRRELFAWLLAGCPPRVRWVAMRDAVLRRVA